MVGYGIASPLEALDRQFGQRADHLGQPSRIGNDIGRPAAVVLGLRPFKKADEPLVRGSLYSRISFQLTKAALDNLIEQGNDIDTQVFDLGVSAQEIEVVQRPFHDFRNRAYGAIR